MIAVVDDETDYLSALPAPLLSLIHDLAFQAGGLRSALALEAASKQLRELLLDHACFQQQVAAQPPPPPPTPEPPTAASTFWPWIAAHGRRVDRLALTVPKLDAHALCPALREQPGLPQARTVAITADHVATPQPLAGLVNLTHLACLRLIPHNPTGSTPLIPLEPLLSLTALRSFTLGSTGGHSHTTTSLAPLAALTALTALQLLHLGQGVTDIAFLPALGPRLRSLRFLALLRVKDLGPIARLTALTSLSLETVFKMDALGAVLVRGLQRLRLAVVKSTSRPGLALDLAPLGMLSNLRTLEMQKLAIVDLQPVARLADTLQVLRMYHVVVNSGWADGEDAQDAGPLISALRHLSVLEVASPLGCSSLDFLAPLTRLQRLCINCSDAVESLAPVAGLAGLRQLHILRAHGARSLEPLRALEGLQQLRLMNMRSASSLQPLVGLTALHAVRLSHCPSISDLRPLCALRRVDELELELVHYRAMPFSLPELLRGLAVQQVSLYQTAYERFELPEWDDQ